MNRGAAILVTPARDVSMMAKAASGAARELVFDLEDAIAPVDKEAARNRLAEFFDAHEPRAAVSVRINGAGTPWHDDDLRVVSGLPVAGLVLPKAETADGVSRVAERSQHPLTALIESPVGVQNAAVIAAVREVAGLVIGYADLAVALGRRGEMPPQRWWYTQERVLGAARAADVRAIDGPWLGIDVQDGFTSAVMDARAAGFDAKWVLHPRQISVVEEAFAPSEHERERAQAIIAAADEAEAAGRGVVQLDGQMIDAPVVVAARRVLEHEKGQQ